MAEVVALGWSAKKDILGKAVYNGEQKKVGKIYDVIISPNKSASVAIVAAGGFLGLGKYDVAIPVGEFKQMGGKIVLEGATKQSIKALPEFKYAKH